MLAKFLSTLFLPTIILWTRWPTKKCAKCLISNLFKVILKITTFSFHKSFHSNVTRPNSSEYSISYYATSRSVMLGTWMQMFDASLCWFSIILWPDGCGKTMIGPCIHIVTQKSTSKTYPFNVGTFTPFEYNFALRSGSTWTPRKVHARIQVNFAYLIKIDADTVFIVSASLV